MKRALATLLLIIVAALALVASAGSADARPRKAPVPWSPAVAAAQIAWQKGLPEVIRIGKVNGHKGCWAAIGRTSYVVCRDGYRTTS